MILLNPGLFVLTTPTSKSEEAALISSANSSTIERNSSTSPSKLDTTQMFIENILYQHINFNDGKPTLSQLIQADYLEDAIQLLE
jgi:hypothetical protein